MLNIVILNGTLCAPSLWRDFTEAEALGVLTKDSSVRVLFPELLPAASVTASAQKIAALIEGLSGETLLLGYSLGGIVALEFAKQFSGLLKGLVLVCTNHRGNTKEKKAAMQRQIDLLEKKGLEAVCDEILLPAYWGPDWSAENFPEKATALQLKQMALEIGPEIFRAQLALLRTRMDQEAFLKDIVLPTLLLCGEDDRLCTAEDNRVMRELLPKAQLEIIRSVGHMLPLLRGKLLAEKIQDFIEEN